MHSAAVTSCEFIARGELRWVVVRKVSDRTWRAIGRDAIGRAGRLCRTSRTG
jgi:hypothetical protein